MSRILFEAFINLLETLIMTDFITQYLGAKYSGRRKNACFIICWLIAFLQMCIMNRMVRIEVTGAFIQVLIYFVYAFLCLNGSVGIKLWISFIVYLMAYSIAIVTNLVICHIIGYDSADMISVFNTTRIVSVIITKIIFFYVTRIVLRNKYKYPLDKHKWLMLIFVPTISLISMGALMGVTLHDTDVKLNILIGMLSIVVADIVTYRFFIVMNKEYENAVRAESLKMQNEVLKRNISDNEMFMQEMRTVRHDIKNQLLTIVQYVDEHKYDSIKEYINDLTNNYMPVVLNYIKTGNTAFDAVVNAKITVCNQKNIFIKVLVKQGTNIDIPPTETAVLFGNLLDNAIEAAADTAEKRITVDISNRGSYLIIFVGNSIKSSVLGSNVNLETSKKDKDLHGIGIKSIKNIVNRHNGMISFYEENNEFCCHIMLESTK